MSEEDKIIDDMTEAVWRVMSTPEKLDCFDIGHKSRDLFNDLFDENIQPDSPIDTLFVATAWAGYDSAMATVAHVLQVDIEAFKTAIAPWYESKEYLPPPDLLDLFKMIDDERKNEQ